MLMLGLNETTDRLVRAVFVGMVMCWGEGGHVLRRVFEYEKEYQG